MESQMRPLEELKPEIVRRAGRSNPFEFAKKEDAEEVVANLTSTDDDHWAQVWGNIGARYEALGEEEQSRRHIEKAAVEFKRDHYMGQVAQLHHTLRSRPRKDQ